MNAGATAERVYGALKAQITGRHFRPGDRLDVAELAGNLASSATPVREALHQLVGEGLVETRTAGGFFLPGWDEPALRDAYAWTLEVLTLSLRRTSSATTRLQHPDADVADTERIGSLFAAIAQQSSNAEHCAAIERANLRLHAVRLVEPEIVNDLEPEYSALLGAFHRGDVPTLRRLITAYHRRRTRAAAAIVRALYRST